METMNNNHPWSDPAAAPEPTVEAVTSEPVASPPEKASFVFRAGGKELFYALLALVCGLALSNFVIFGGFELGFAIGMCAFILCAAGYLLASGGKLNVYSTLLLLLSLGISAGFGRSADGFVKFVMLCFLLVSVNLGLCLMTGQNRRSPGAAGSLLDAGRTLFSMGYGQIPRAAGGLFSSLRLRGSLARMIGSVALGLVIVLPVLCIMLRLLIKADVAFENMMKILPELNMREVMGTVPVGIALFFILYTRAVALAHKEKAQPVAKGSGKGLNKITMNTVLIGVCLVYMLYLVSQLAYFVGGFAGILPEDFTMAEYARRGFFEMAALTGIDLTVMLVAVFLVRKTDGKTPLLTKLLCLFIGLATLFMVVAASGKMIMYIGGYGLTRMRVMTELVTIFLGIAMLVMLLWLFAPKLPYMKILVTVALLMGAATLWADVDTVVASYNVNAYQSGQLENVDVRYLSTLNDGAVPYIAQLTDDSVPGVANEAKRVLKERYMELDEDYDFRGWNYVKDLAQDYVIKPNA